MALQTATIYAKLGASEISLHGLRFESLTSVDETERPPGGGVAPAVLGVIEASGYVLDTDAGTIRRADGLADVWARIVYDWDDAQTQEELDYAQATADLLLSMPDFRNNLAAALERLHTGAGSIQAQADAISTNATTAPITTIIDGLQAATITSFANAQTAIRNIGTVLESMRSAHNLEAQAIKDEAIYLRRSIQVLASSLGIPLS